MAASPARRKLEQLQRRLPSALMEAERANLEDALRLARGLSSGPLTAADLRRMDHPYARRHAGSAGGSPQTGVGRPDIINRRTGRFLAGWKTDGPVLRGAGTRIESRLVNRTPEAAFLQAGTKTMVPRPVDVTVLKLLAPLRRQRIADVMRRLYEELRTG